MGYQLTIAHGLLFRPTVVKFASQTELRQYLSAVNYDLLVMGRIEVIRVKS